MIAVLHVSTNRQITKGSYPNVDNKKDLEFYESNPKKHYGGLKLRKIKTHNNYQLNALMHVRINAFFYYLILNRSTINN